MSTYNQRTAFQKHLKLAQRRECAKVGMSVPFPAKFKGTCPLSGLKYPVGEPVAFFRDYKQPCLVVPINRVLEAERVARAPKCGCGLEATEGRHYRLNEPDPCTACRRCDWVATIWYGTDDVTTVTRDSVPLSLQVQP